MVDILIQNDDTQDNYLSLPNLMKKNLKKEDPRIYELIQEEANRQQDGLEMIPSENYVSPAVLEAMGSILTNKYSEGYPNRRYYGGNEIVDKVESLAIERAKKLFGVEHANVQPYSGSPANLAVYFAVCKPGDTIMGLDLSHGGHLTHGAKFSFSSTYYNSIPYHVKPDGHVDIDEVWKLAKEHKPKLIWTGGTAYVFQFEFDKFVDIADSCGAYLAADIAHTAGLVVSGAHIHPGKYVHIITTTTHKTLRGPRGAMIMVTKKGVEKDPELPSRIDKSIIPGLQGGPHNHTTAAIAVALKEASTAKFRRYGQQIVKNAKALAENLMKEGFTLIGNGTENHSILINLVPNLGPGAGFFMQYGLDAIGISLNKNTIPGEPSTPFYPSGCRLGTPCLTTRGMKEAQMKQIAAWYKAVLDEIKPYTLPKNKEERQPYLKSFREDIKKNKKLKKIREQVRRFARKYPVPGI